MQQHNTKPPRMTVRTAKKTDNQIELGYFIAFYTLFHLLLHKRAQHLATQPGNKI